MSGFLLKCYAIAGSIPKLTRLVYMDTYAELGGMIELLELAPRLDGNIKFFEGAAKRLGW